VNRTTNTRLGTQEYVGLSSSNQFRRSFAKNADVLINPIDSRVG